jgi:hypothetical protein
MERVKGIEPSYSAWEAAALPLSYTRKAAENGEFLDHEIRRFTHAVYTDRLICSALATWTAVWST